MKEETLIKIQKQYEKELKKEKRNKAKKESNASQNKEDYGRGWSGLSPFIVEISEEHRNNQLLNKAFQKYLSEIKEDDTNGIYLYIGDDLRDVEEGLAFYYVYWNLEQGREVVVKGEEDEEFVNSHTIIYSEEDNRGALHMLEDVYPDVRVDFLRKALETDQTTAKEYVISKYKKH